MAHKYPDRVADATSSTGTGSLVLDRPSLNNYRNVGDVCENGDTIYLSIAHRRLPQWETGKYTYGAGIGALTRTLVLTSSNGGSAVNFSEGIKDIVCGLPGSVIEDVVDMATEALASTTFMTPVLVSGATTVSTDHNRKLLCPGGSAYYDITLAAASNYPDPFCVLIYNRDSGRYKGIVVPGFGNFRLAPLHLCTVIKVNGAWVADYPRVWDLNGNVQFNIDPSSGSDADVGVSGSTDGMGTGSGAFATLQGAGEFVQKFINSHYNTVTLQAAAGSYSAGLSLAVPWQGNTIVRLRGDTSTPANCTLTVPNNQYGISMADNAAIDVAGFKFVSAGSALAALRAAQDGIMDYGQCDFGAFPGAVHILVDRGGHSNALANYNISGGAVFHASVNEASRASLGQAQANFITASLGFTRLIDATAGSVVRFVNFTVGGAHVGSATGQIWKLDINCSGLNGGTTPDTTLSGLSSMSGGALTRNSQGDWS